MNIKVAGKQDEFKIATLMKEFMDYYRKKHPKWGKCSIMSTEELLWSFHDALENPHTAAFILVEEDNEPVAISTLTFWHGMNTKDTVITIDDLYVRSQWRQHGVGSKIVDYVVDMGRKMGYSTIEVILDEDKNSGAEKFCRKMGFQKTEKDRFQKKIKVAV